MSKEILFKLVDLVFTSKASNIRLKFFGGEPLLEFGLIKEATKYASKLERLTKKKVSYLITTNGLLLNKEKLKYLSRFKTEIMVSLDGTQETCSKFRDSHFKNKNLYNNVIYNLIQLKNSKINHFINIIVDPDNIHNLYKDIEHLVNLGIKRLQICYRVGKRWNDTQVDRLINELKKIGKDFHMNRFNNAELLNFSNQAEPVMLCDEIIIDCDGKIYFEAAVFLEKKFPDLMRMHHLGHVDNGHILDSLMRTKYELFKAFTSLYPSTSRLNKVIHNNIDMGLKLKNFYEACQIESNNDRSENILINRFIKEDFNHQKQFLNRNFSHIDSFFVYLKTGCFNNCIFCKNKSVELDPIELIEVEYKLRANQKYKFKKVSIIGNEPLMHPNIIDTVKLCKKFNFKDIEILSSGNLLSDYEFVKSLIANGVNIFSLPLFSMDSYEHDSITRNKGSFHNVIRGISILQKFNNIKIFVHTNLVRQNLHSLNRLEGYVKNELKLPFCILPVRSKDSNYEYKDLMPTYTEMIKKLRVDSLMGFPICVVRRIQKNLFLKSSDISDSIKIYMLDQNFIKLKK